MNDPTRRELLSASLLGVLQGCGRRALLGGTVRRVVSLVPSATECLFALGAGPRVVGVSRYDDFPDEVRMLPHVGGMLDPSFEAVAALRPDAVVGARGPTNRAVLDRLERMGIRMLFPSVESLQEIYAAIDAYAALVARSEQASVLKSSIQRSVGRVQQTVRGRSAPSVLAVFGQRPIVAAGPGSFVDELLTLAGGRNAVRSGPRWATLSLEAVLSLSPEVILDMTAMEGHVSLASLWANYGAIPAVRDGRVVRLEQPMLTRPGPRVGLALAVYARALHPGLTIEGVS